tara:strand:- start:185 stop:571 length:387 start_codon:yes stop_codon:yes gene_type:complete
MIDIEVKKIFNRGVECFNSKNYYTAHDCFEEIWTDYKINDRLFMQALIQLSVAYFHISNINKGGAIGLFKKSIKKLELYKDKKNIIKNINTIIDSANKSYKLVSEIDDIKLFNWELAPILEIRDNQEI